MGESTPRLALIRLSGEIGVKGRATRMQFRKRLIQNLRDALVAEGLPPRVEVSHDRLYVELPEHASLDDHALTRVFGVQSLSLVERQPVTSLDDIVRIGASLFTEMVRGRRFAVRARRVGQKRSDSTRAKDVEIELGTRLLPHSEGVDLGNPEVTVSLEMTTNATSFFSDVRRGPGGLPLGVEARGVSLLSGGFDSAVATWQVQKRGVDCDYVFCNLGGASHLREVLRVAKHLGDRWSYGARPRLHAIDFEPVAQALQQHTVKRYWQVLLKRQMLRAAEAIARETGAFAIATGDAVGQVSSQTLPNLAAVSEATSMVVLRPLVGFDKEEITARARAIGSYELSKAVGEYCALVTSRPATQAKLETVLYQESLLPEGLLEDLVTRRTVFELHSFDESALDADDLAVEKLPADAVLIDLRPLAQFRSGHHPDAIHLDFAKALAAYPSMDRSQRYVLSCEYGLLSAQLAEHMRRDGFSVQHFRGGQRALMKSVA